MMQQQTQRYGHNHSMRIVHVLYVHITINEENTNQKVEDSRKYEQGIYILID